MSASFLPDDYRQAGRQARELLVYVKHALRRLHLMEPILRVGSINDTLNMILVRCGRIVGARRAQLKGARAGGDGGGETEARLLCLRYMGICQCRWGGASYSKRPFCFPFLSWWFRASGVKDCGKKKRRTNPRAARRVSCVDDASKFF